MTATATPCVELRRIAAKGSLLDRHAPHYAIRLEGAITGIARAVMSVSRAFGEEVPDEGSIRVMHDDSIIQDVATEKAQDMREVGVTLHPW